MLSTFLLLTAFSIHLLPIQAYDFSTLKLCTTKYGAKSTYVKTTSYAVTVPVIVTQKYTNTPTSTITPPPQTSTTTSTATTTSVVVTTPTQTFTDTAYSTSTTTTTTITTIDTTTITTATVQVATSTVPTAAGFTPISQENGYVPKKRSHEADLAPAIRGRRVEERTTPKTPACPIAGKPGSFHQYPQAVTCGALIIAKTTTTKTYTATSTATTTLSPMTNIATSTTTTTITSTSAAAPASTTTTTTQIVTSTETATSTTTNTATASATIIQAQSTVYAACSSSNLINHANGNQGINSVYTDGSSDPITNAVAASDPVACCEQCQKSAGCTGFAQYPGEALCYYFTVGQCDGSNTFGLTFETNAGFDPTNGYTIGNGPCGQLGNGGSG